MSDLPVVVALGGNAISPPGRSHDVTTQFERTRQTAAHLARLADHPLVVTHGNGPQVGDALLRSELGSRSSTHGSHARRLWSPWQRRLRRRYMTGSLADHVPRLPLDVCVAETLGAMGYMLEQCLDAALRAAGTPRPVAALVTRTLVDADDPALGNPTKPVGSFYPADEARRRMAADGWTMREDAGRGWRRVVPSPEPRQVLEVPAIRTLLAAGTVVVAAGGGGIPVARQPDGTLTGVEAVVDKDLASALLASEVGAEVLLVLTGVAHVALEFGQPGERPLHEVTASELAHHAEQGQFAAGSMLPKVRAVLRFLERGGKRAVITTPALADRALAGQAGTEVRS